MHYSSFQVIEVILDTVTAPWLVQNSAGLELLAAQNLSTPRYDVYWLFYLYKKTGISPIFNKTSEYFTRITDSRRQWKYSFLLFQPTGGMHLRYQKLFLILFLAYLLIRLSSYYTNDVHHWLYHQDTKNLPLINTITLLNQNQLPN